MIWTRELEGRIASVASMMDFVGCHWCIACSPRGGYQSREVLWLHSRRREHLEGNRKGLYEVSWPLQPQKCPRHSLLKMKTYVKLSKIFNPVCIRVSTDARVPIHHVDLRASPTASRPESTRRAATGHQRTSSCYLPEGADASWRAGMRSIACYFMWFDLQWTQAEDLVYWRTST